MAAMIVKGFVLALLIASALFVVFRLLHVPKPAFGAVISSFGLFVAFSGWEQGFGREGGGFAWAVFLWLLLHLIVLFALRIVSGVLDRVLPR